MERADLDRPRRDEPSPQSLAGIPDLLTPFVEELREPEVEFEDVVRACGARPIYQIMNLGVRAGLMVVFPEILGAAAAVFVFFRAFNEALAD